MAVIKYILGIAFVSLIGAFLENKIWPIILTDRSGPEYPHSFELSIGPATMFTIISFIVFIVIKHLFKPSIFVLVLEAFLLPGLVYFTFAMAFGFDFRGLLLVCISQGTCFVIFVLIDIYMLSRIESKILSDE